MDTSSWGPHTTLVPHYLEWVLWDCCFQGSTPESLPRACWRGGIPRLSVVVPWSQELLARVAPLRFPSQLVGLGSVWGCFLNLPAACFL